MIARFGHERLGNGEPMPRGFFDDLYVFGVPLSLRALLFLSPSPSPTHGPNAACLNAAAPASVRVAEDEARHFTMLDKRLKELGAGFGDLPVHNGGRLGSCRRELGMGERMVMGGKRRKERKQRVAQRANAPPRPAPNPTPGLWQSASETACGSLARLAVVHMVHEARGEPQHGRRPRKAPRLATILSTRSSQTLPIATNKPSLA